MKNLSLREKILLAVMVFCFIFYGYYIYLILPVQKKIDTKRNMVSNYETIKSSINSQKIQKAKLSKELEAQKSKYSNVSSMLPEIERYPEIAYKLKSFSDSSGTVLSSVNFGTGADFAAQKNSNESNKNTAQNTSKDSEKLMMVPVTLNVQGEYQGIKKFISNIESDSRISEISNVNLTMQNSGQNGAQNVSGTSINAQIVLSYYYVSTNQKVNADTTYNFVSGTFGKTDPYK